jgi:hypothetical protein
MRIAPARPLQELRETPEYRTVSFRKGKRSFYGCKKIPAVFSVVFIGD